MSPARFLLLTAFVLLHASARGEDGSSTACLPPKVRDAAKTQRTDQSNIPVEARADSVRAERGTYIDLEGAAEIIRGEDWVKADRLRYEKPTDTARAQGNAQFHSMGDSFYSQQMEIQLNTREGEIGQGGYRLRNDTGRGEIGEAQLKGHDHTVLKDVTYTTCRDGQDDWFLHIRELDLDHAEDVGTAHHASVEFLGWPIFYFPYLSFPLGDQRKSGFLFPRIGQSDKLGFDASAPYYFNVAPNYDATVTPRVMTKRGFQLQNQFRYMTSESSGVLELDVLPNDKVADDDRAAGVFRHQQTFSPLWSGNVDVRAASDKDYFEDFGDRLNLTSQSYLPQTADVTYRGAAWTFVTRLSDHQTVDRNIAPADQPYARLPQVQFVSTNLPLPNRWYPQLETEWNRFEHDVLLTGERLNLNTGISLPLQNEWAFVTPKVGARYISYHLDRENDETPSVGRGVFSMDSGLFFERDTDWSGRSTVQTLEPRLYYLYIPDKNQNALPNFDTGLPDFSFAALFRENRFNGGDRIGDANQLTAALTTRWLDVDEGVERLRLSIGRIYYFDDLDVNVPASVQQRNASDLVAEASAWLVANWHARETVQWNTDDHRIERSSSYLQYQPARDKIVSLGYVFMRGQIGEIDASTEWPLGGRWSLRARSLYSTLYDRNTETYAGFEYNACCWALRALAGRRFQNPEQVNQIMFELQLNGLAKYGSVPDRPLKQGLFYTNDEAKNDTLFR
jgi:LPS-assembly protein